MIGWPAGQSKTSHKELTLSSAVGPVSTKLARGSDHSLGLGGGGFRPLQSTSRGTRKWCRAVQESPARYLGVLGKYSRIDRVSEAWLELPPPSLFLKCSSTHIPDLFGPVFVLFTLFATVARPVPHQLRLTKWCWDEHEPSRHCPSFLRLVRPYRRQNRPAQIALIPLTPLLVFSAYFSLHPPPWRRRLMIPSCVWI